MKRKKPDKEMTSYFQGLGTGMGAAGATSIFWHFAFNKPIYLFGSIFFIGIGFLFYLIGAIVSKK